MRNGQTVLKQFPFEIIAFTVPPALLYTQAVIVRSPKIFNDELFETSTASFIPSKERALPTFPVVQIAPLTVAEVPLV